MSQKQSSPSIEGIFDQVRLSRPEIICLEGILSLIRAKYVFDSRLFEDFFEPYFQLIKHYYSNICQVEPESTKIISKIREYQNLISKDSKSKKTKASRKAKIQPQKVQTSRLPLQTNAKLV